MPSPRSSTSSVATVVAASFMGLALGVAGCSKLYEFRGDVTVAPAVELPADAKVVLVADRGDGRVDTADLQRESGTRHFTGKGSTCCSPDVRASFYAYVDLDGDGTWDEGEPRGEDPAGRVQLRDEPHVAVVEIR